MAHTTTAKIGHRLAVAVDGEVDVQATTVSVSADRRPSRAAAASDCCPAVITNPSLSGRRGGHGNATDVMAGCAFCRCRTANGHFSAISPVSRLTSPVKASRKTQRHAEGGSASRLGLYRAAPIAM